MILMKTLVVATLLVTAWALPQASEYNNYYDYEELWEEENYDNYDSPPQFLFEQQHLKATEGKTVVIPCDCTSTSHVLVIKKAKTTKEKEFLFFVDNVKVRREQRYKLNGQQLHISNIRVSDAGTYICRLESNPPVQISHVLEVLYAPTVTTIVREVVVREGASVTLECQAEGNPIPTIKWSKQNGSLPSGVLEEDGDSINLADVDRHVEGNYICTADNGVGRLASDVMSVIVEYPPEVLTEKDITRTSDGDTLEIVCIVHGRPTPIIEWSKDGRRLSYGSHVEAQHIAKHRHSIKIAQITGDDFGEYTCIAKNILGVAMSSISFSGLPKFLHFTSSPHGREETTYTLTWDVESYYPITEYRIRYRRASASDSLDDAGGWTEMRHGVSEDLQTNGLVHSMIHTLKDLEAATDYIVTVQVKNQYLWGENAEFFFSTRKEVAQTTENSGISIMSVSSVLFLIVVFLFAV